MSTDSSVPAPRADFTAGSLPDVREESDAGGSSERVQHDEDVGASPLRPATIAFYAVAVLSAGIAFVRWWGHFVGWIWALNGGVSKAMAAGVLIVSLCWAFMLVRWCVFLSLSFRRLFRESRRVRPHIEEWPCVSILIPAYNEGETIVPALTSLLQLDYPAFDVTVIDDGSPDDTFAKATQFAREHPELNIRVYRKPNGGKWSAHNFGFQRSRGELVLCLDADSRLRPKSLKRLVERMIDPQVAAVAGQVCVRNRTNVVTWLQSLEYLMANGALRLAQSESGHVLVVPGPIGLFRRSVMEDVFLRYGSHASEHPGEVAGPFEGDTFAEDFDLSVAILSMGHRIVYEPAAVSDTRAPDTILTLLNQRYRWARGSLQVVKKFLRRGELHGGPSRHPALYGWMSVCYIAEIAMFPFIYGMSLIFLAPWLVHPASFSVIAAGTALVWTLNASIAGLYIAVHNDDRRLLLVVPLLDYYFGFLLSAGLAFSLFDECRNTRMKW